MNYKKTVIILSTLVASLTGMAQFVASPLRSANNGSDTSQWDFHFSTGGAVLSGFGNTQALTWVSPWASYHANDRLTLHGGFAAAGTLLPNNFALQGRWQRSLAPRREGTRAGALRAAAEYQANDNLRIWLAVATVRGWMQPLWADASQPLAATAVDGGFTYRFNGGSVLGMHFLFVHDQYGTLAYPPYMGYPCYNPLYPTWGINSGLWTL